MINEDPLSDDIKNLHLNVGIQNPHRSVATRNMAPNHDIIPIYKKKVFGEEVKTCTTEIPTNGLPSIEVLNEKMILCRLHHPIVTTISDKIRRRTRQSYGVKFVYKQHKKANRYRPLIHPLIAISVVHVPKTHPRHQLHHPSPLPKIQIIQWENPLLDEQLAINQISRRQKFPYQYAEPAMKLSEDGLSLLKTANFPDDIINNVSVVQLVKNLLKRQVFTFSKIDRIVNDIIVNLIILPVRIVVKALKDNVCNLKMLQFDILNVLLVTYLLLCVLF